MDMINLYNSNFQVIFDSTIYQNGLVKKYLFVYFFPSILSNSRLRCMLTIFFLIYK